VPARVAYGKAEDRGPHPGRAPKCGFAGGWTGIATIPYEPLDDAAMMYIVKVSRPLRDGPTDKGRTPQ
jgi:hypothetical protein